MDVFLGHSVQSTGKLERRRVCDQGHSQEFTKGAHQEVWGGSPQQGLGQNMANLENTSGAVIKIDLMVDMHPCPLPLWLHPRTRRWTITKKVVSFSGKMGEPSLTAPGDTNLIGSTKVVEDPRRILSAAEM